VSTHPNYCLLALAVICFEREPRTLRPATTNNWVNIGANLLAILRVNVVEIDEPCAHEIQFGGMCAECGKDMTA
jgi:hypothetical protein